MANPDSRYGEIMAFLEGKKQHAFNLWADSGISTRAWKKYTAKIDNQILRIVNSIRLGKSDVVPFSAGILKTRGLVYRNVDIPTLILCLNILFTF